MSERKKHFTLEEKLELVKLSLEGLEPVTKIADRFGITSSTLYSWRKKFLKDEKSSLSGKGGKKMTDLELRNQELEKKLRETELERDILKKAVGIFSKNDRKFSNL